MTEIFSVALSPVFFGRFLAIRMTPKRFSKFDEGTFAQSDQRKENGVDPRLPIVLPLGGGHRNRTATITLNWLTEDEQEQVEAAIQSLLASVARQAISEKEGRDDVQL